VLGVKKGAISLGALQVYKGTISPGALLV
jgi:hypothetical protein